MDMIRDRGKARFDELKMPAKVETLAAHMKAKHTRVDRMASALAAFFLADGGLDVSLEKLRNAAGFVACDALEDAYRDLGRNKE